MLEYNVLITVLIGAALLFFGRSLFWLFVAVAGFVAGTVFVQQYLGDASHWLAFAIAITAGLIGAVLAVMVQRVAIAVAGFVLGAFFVLQLRDLWSLPLDGLALWIAVVLAGLIALVLMVALFDVALIVLSSVAGAQIILGAFDVDVATRTAAFLVLVLIGVLAQLEMRRKGRPADA